MCSWSSFDVKSTLYGINVPPDDTQKHTTPGGAPLERWSARRKDLYMSVYNTLQRQKNMA